MSKLLWVLLIIAIIAALSAGSLWNRYQLRQRIKRSWGHIPRGSLRSDHEESLKATWQTLIQQKKPTSLIDDHTWYDLDMFAVFEMINATHSSIGSEALYARMRGYNFTATDQDQLEPLITFLANNPKEREKIQFALAGLGKRDFNRVFEYLSDPQAHVLPNSWMYRILAVGPLIAFLLIFISPKIMLAALLLVLVLNVMVYFTKKEAVEKELLSMNYLVHMLLLSKRLAKIEQPLKQEFHQLHKLFRSIERVAFSFRLPTGSDQEMFLEYLNMMFMLPFIAYDFVLRRIQKHVEQAQYLWQLIGQLDAALAILNFQLYMPKTCQPVFQQKLSVQAEESYHPLLAQPVTNPVAWTQSTLVTGSNASGKSTYVKSVAINCILAQTIGLACAESFRMPRGHVLTSMALEDNLFAGESYFIAEIKSIKRIIKQAASGEPCLFFIDEILRGTNTVERIAASASVIRWLQNYHTLAFVATHDSELTTMLQHYCANVHFSEEVSDEEGIHFSYKLQQGPATDHNAIRLLAALNYPGELVTAAKQTAAVFEKEHSWPIIP